MPVLYCYTLFLFFIIFIVFDDFLKKSISSEWYYRLNVRQSHFFIFYWPLLHDVAWWETYKSDREFVSEYKILILTIWKEIVVNWIVKMQNIKDILSGGGVLVMSMMPLNKTDEIPTEPGWTNMSFWKNWQVAVYMFI